MDPLLYPVFFFAADDFSWLRLHPMQRPAWGMYAIYIIRVTLLLMVIPVCGTHGGSERPCPKLINEDPSDFYDSPLIELHDAFDHIFFGSTIHLLRHEWERPGHFLTVLWVATAEVVISLSVLWVILSVFIVLAAWFGRFIVTERDEVLLKRVDCIATAINNATKRQDVEQCRKELEGLANLEEREGGCKTFEFTTAINPFKPNPVMVGVLSAFHLFLRLMNAYTYAQAGRVRGILCCFVMTLHVLLSIAEKCRLSQGDPYALLTEIQKSLDSGIFTPALFEALKTDKGVLTFPSLVFSAANLPWTIYLSGHSIQVQILQAIAQVVGFISGIVGSGLFVFQEFDLGIERDGMGDAPRLWSRF